MSDQPIRILGLSIDPLADFRARPEAKNAQLYGALDRRYGVVGVMRPALPRIERYVRRLRYFHPNQAIWHARAGFNRAIFERRTLLVEQYLRQMRGRYDLIVQLGAVFAPGLQPQRQPYVVTMDNTYRNSERYYPAWVAQADARQRDIWLKLERAVYQRAAFLFPWSEFTRRSLIEDYAIPAEKVIAVGAGMHLQAASLQGKRYDTQVALFVGEDFERKGGLVLLEAWRAVRERLPEAQLWIVGPPPGDAALPGIRWLGHMHDRQALSRLYADASVFVMPSLFDPWGHVFLEAMGHGLPCIGADHCAMPEIIQHAATGLLVPPGQAAALAQALVRLLSEPAYAERLGRQGYARAVGQYSWDAVIGRMAPYIEQAVAGAPASLPLARSYSI